MKIIVDPKALEKTLEAVLPIAKLSLARDELAGLTQITADTSGVLTIKSASYDGRVTAALECTVEKAGTVCLNGEEFETILKKVKADEIVLTLNKTTLSISAGKARFRLSVYPESSFYEWPELEASDMTVTLSGDDALSLFGGVLHARKMEKTVSDATAGIFMDIENGILRTVATDSHRMALRALGIADLGGGEKSALLSLATVERLASIAKISDTITLTLRERNITIEGRGASYDMRLLGTAFPDYRRVIPSNPAVVAVLDRKELLEIVDRLLTIKPEIGRLTMRIHADAVHIQAQKDANLASEDIDLEYTVDPEKYDPDRKDGRDVIEIDISGRFIVDSLKSMESTLVELHLHGPERPISLKPHRFVQDTGVERDVLEVLVPLN